MYLTSILEHALWLLTHGSAHNCLLGKSIVVYLVEINSMPIFNYIKWSNPSHAYVLSRNIQSIEYHSEYSAYHNDYLCCFFCRVEEI